MISIPYVEIRGYQLISELRANGLTIEVNGLKRTGGNTLYFMVDDSQANIDIVNATMASHVPNPSFDDSAFLAEDLANKHANL